MSQSKEKAGVGLVSAGVVIALITFRSINRANDRYPETSNTGDVYVQVDEAIESENEAWLRMNILEAQQDQLAAESRATMADDLQRILDTLPPEARLSSPN